MHFTAVKVQAYVDGATLTAVKDRNGRIHYDWSGVADSSVKRKAQRRAAIMLRKFDIAPDSAPTRQLSLPDEAP